jgi:acetyltransferase-like isoleucine patch superfamily enzyme
MKTLFDTIKELIRTIDKLFVFVLFFFDHYAVSHYLNRWQIAKIGNKTWISTNARFDLFKNAEAKKLGRPIIAVGNNCVITEYTQLITHDTSFNFFRKLNKLPEQHKWGEIVIEDNVFIGAGCIILPGVTIHSNVLVGAGSVVTKDLESGFVYAGNPAKKLISIPQYIK